MDLRFSAEDEAFRAEVRDFLESSLTGEFAVARGRGGPGDELVLVDDRKAWERHLGANGWTCVGWPKEHGGRGLSLHQQVIYHEEYVRARAPGRVGHVGETLLGPTVIAYGSAEQQARFLPPIVAGTELWCQGYSEPDAGSDLANIKTKAVLEADEWVIDGQKVWTSLAQWSQWCFVLARTDPEAPKHKGISYLLVPMDQPGVELRPIVQLSRDAEFNETFFDGARTAAGNVVGGVDNGWTVAMGTLALERGVSTLGQNLHFAAELDEVLERARGNGRITDPSVRQRAVALWTRLHLMRLNALRVMSSSVDTPPAATVTKLFWANLHQAIGELAMDVLGAEATVLDDDGDYTRLQRVFLFSRADTIYGGSDQVQRNIIGERALGLPKEPALMVPSYVPGHGLLAGKTVVVTAAAGTGIGFATAKRAVEEGATVLLSDAHERRLAESAAELGVPAIPCDVTHEAAVQGLIDGAVAELGRIDVLVNNAGLGGEAPIVDMTDEQWSRVLDITLTGTFRMTRAALRVMQPAGAGVIVNNASVLGWHAQHGQAHYAAAKAGVMALTRCAAIEAAEFGVRVNAVAPSIAMHEFLAKVTTDELLDELTSREAFGRAAEPWEVANVIVFLASDYSSYMTGEVVSVSSHRA